MKIDNLVTNISKWGHDRGITINGKPYSQLLKAMSELGETSDALLKNDKESLKDGIGDTFVCLVMLAETSGLTIEECIEAAWEEIKDRRGFLNENGTFIKESS